MGKKESKAEKEAREKKEAEMKCKAEADAKEAAESEDEDDDGDGDHDDADQDKELIKKMLDEYVGKSDDMDKAEREAMEGIGMEAYQAHKEMGASESEAYERAGHAVKLAKHMAAKQAEAEAKEAEGDDDDDDADKKKVPPKKDDGDGKDGKDDDGDDDDKESEAMESKRMKSLEKRLLEAEGKIAAFQAREKKDSVLAYVDKALRESGQPMSITKKFREAAGEFKSVKDFDSKWSIFLEGVKNTRQVLDWTPIAEKSLMQESDSKETSTKSGLDFSQAADEEI